MLALLFRTLHNLFLGSGVTKLLNNYADGTAKKSVLGMVPFYKEVIKDLQKKLPLEDVLLKSLTCLNHRNQRSPNSLQHCKVVASHMPSLQQQDEIIAGDEWIHYQEIDIGEEDLKLKRVDHFWHKVFTKGDGSGDCFVVLPKMVKCALALCHSIADVERSLSTNKKVVTKHNVSMKKETITGLQSVKAAANYTGHSENCRKFLLLVQ